MVDLPDGWRKAGRIEAWRLGRSLHRRFGPGHPLAGARFWVMALHDDGAQCLVAAEGTDAPYYVVHLPQGTGASIEVSDGRALMDPTFLEESQSGPEMLEDTQLFYLGEEEASAPVAMELWVHPVAPVRCEKVMLFPGGTFDVVPLIGDAFDLSRGINLASAKEMLAEAGYQMAGGPVALALHEDEEPKMTGQSISFWLGNENGERTIWSVLETPGEEFSMQRVDGDQPSVLFFSSQEEVEIALQNRDCAFIDRRMALN
ncbi:MAG: hypothetical protein KDE11_16155 [Rhodobacteraceae bacterium]|nr:hypothetical protein [Paracoccaceae bacterium]